VYIFKINAICSVTFSASDNDDDDDDDYDDDDVTRSDTTFFRLNSETLLSTTDQHNQFHANSTSSILHYHQPSELSQTKNLILTSNTILGFVGSPADRYTSS
jgi:hypothetical protein